MLSRLQRKIIFPGSGLRDRSTSHVAPPVGATLIPIFTDNLEKIVVMSGPARRTDGMSCDHAESRPHLIYFYGNAMSLAEATWEFEYFQSCGCNIWIPDYLGYGQSGGEASEKGCYQTADTVYNYLCDELKIPATKIIVAGWSLGAAVAIDLASRHQVAGLITLSPFTSILGMVSQLSDVFTVLSPWITERFESLQKITRIGCPIMIGHGKNDQTIPHAMGEILADVAGKAKLDVTFISVEQAGHNDILTYGDPILIQEISDFIERVTSMHD